MSKFKKGSIPWNKGKKAKDYPKLQASLDKAHEASRKKGAWNKGLTKETDERVLKYAKAERTSEWCSKIGKTHKKNKKLSTYLKNRTPEQKMIQLTKAWLTKKINGTANTSEPERKLYEKLLAENENKHIYRNYKCDRYPYYCDFYIEEDDLFIELNAHWTHGGHPFDENNEDDLEKLAEWEEKAKTSKFYANAIQTWTVRDVEKQQCAKENKLNYIVIY